MKPVQYFYDQYLERCKEMTPDQIIQFLDDFRQLHGTKTPSRSKQISLRIPENLLNAFKTRAMLEGTPYQTQIKVLMKAWLTNSESTASNS